jgi:hypothetical protein
MCAHRDQNDGFFAAVDDARRNCRQQVRDSGSFDDCECAADRLIQIEDFVATPIGVLADRRAQAVEMKRSRE